MDLTYDNDSLIFHHLTHFSLSQCLCCGQAFRWKLQGSGFRGVALGYAVYAEQNGQDLTLKGVPKSAAPDFIRYFDLERDYGAIQASYINDPFLTEGIRYAEGLRVMRQPFFETLISFIISANNNVGRISRIIDTLCEKYGEPLEGGNDFPTPEKLAALTPEELKACGTGYRADYIIGTAKMVCDGFDLDMVANMPYEQARLKMTELPGVGLKVADCAALYGMGFLKAFPLDVWMRRVICGVYNYDGKNDKALRDFVDTTFGENAGIAQQYLFHYARHHKDTVCER
jgi:N-glycosylase/DNA lyase